MYTFKYGGKRGKSIELKESADKIVIRTKDNKKLDATSFGKSGRDVMASTDEVLSFPEAGISVRRIEATNDTEALTKRDAARAALKEEGDVRFAGRVLEDAETGEVMLYTENFFIKFKNETADEKCLALLTKYALVVKAKLPFAEKSWFVEAPEGTGLKTFDIADAVLKEGIVEFCHPEIVQERRSKGLSAEHWHLAPTTINGAQINAHVNILDAWKHTKGKGITIAIVDDGVDIDHPEFAGRIVHPRDVTLNIDDPRPKETDDNHGTACAGVAVAGGIKASGTAPEANLMPIRLRNGLGSMAEAQAFAWAADHGADVISCSWGPADGRWWDIEDPTHTRRTMLPDSTRLAIDYAMTKGRAGKGCVVLFAAGNGNEETDTDGYVSYPPVIAVAACNDSSKRSIYSDFGKAVWVSFPSRDFGYKPFKHPQPLTPGIFTTDRVGAGGYQATDYHDAFSGTSSACPGVAGVIGLMLAANPDLKPAEVKDILRLTCDKIDTAEGEYDANGHSEYYGYGRINAANAVVMAKQKRTSNAGTITTGTAGAVKGFVKFAKRGEVALRSSEAYKQTTGDKFVGLQMQSQVPGVQIKTEVNFSTTGLLTSDKGDVLQAKDARGSMIGLGFTLIGPKAAEYALSFEVAGTNGVSKKGTSGQFIGTRKAKGTAIQSFSVAVVKK
jgi:subtilisin family serine protease